MAITEYKGIQISAQPPAAALTKQDIRALYTLLEEICSQAVEKHIQGIRQRAPADTDFDELEKAAEDYRAAGKLKAYVYGRNGEQLALNSVHGLSDEILPTKIKRVSFDSAAGLIESHRPINRFVVTLDFEEPPLLGTYNPWEEATPNISSIELIGSDTTWVNGANAEINNFLTDRGRKRKWLHTTAVYNFFHWLVGLPLAFWFVYRIDVEFSAYLDPIPVVLRGAIYVYLVLISFLAFRIVFGLLRWAFPLFEFEDSPSTGARTIALGVVLSIVGSIIWDAIKQI